MAPCIFHGLLSSVCRPDPNTFYTSRCCCCFLPVSPWVCRVDETFIVYCLFNSFSPHHQMFGTTVESHHLTCCLQYFLSPFFVFNSKNCKRSISLTWKGCFVGSKRLTQLGEYGNEVLMLPTGRLESHSFTKGFSQWDFQGSKNFIHKNETNKKVLLILAAMSVALILNTSSHL